MQSILIIVGIALVLFVLAFKSKKRFGNLSLALAGGAVINEVWAYEISLVAGIFKFLPHDVNAFIVSTVVLLLPALLLMLNGVAYKNIITRFFGSFLFSLLALAFMAKSMTQILSLDGTMKVYYLKIISYKELVIGMSIIIAILEIFFTKLPKHDGKPSKY